MRSIVNCLGALWLWAGFGVCMRRTRQRAARIRGVAPPCRGLELAVALTAGIFLTAAAGAEPPPEGAPPPLPPAVSKLLETPYLTESERADIRVRHGAWTAADLAEPARRARAALLIGRWDDPALNDTAADPLDRAEALIERGKCADALALLPEPDAKPALRALYLRGRALGLGGQRDAAIATLRTLAQRVQSERQSDADQLVAGVLGLDLLSDLAGPGVVSKAAANDRGAAVDADSRAMMSMLARAREELDRLNAAAPLAEARLLAKRDNFAEAQDALGRALTLSPRHAGALALLGEMAVAFFDFERAQKIIDEMRGQQLPALSGAVAPSAAHALADALECRLRLRQNDAEGALAALAPSLAAYPDRPELLAAQAAALAAAFRDEESAAVLARLDSLSPGTPAGYLLVGQVLSDHRQYESAARHLEEAAKRAPALASAVIELGLLELQSGRDERALAALERAQRLDPFNVRAANSLKLVRELAGYARVQSEHFVVRFKPGVDEVLAREMLPVLERIHARVTGDGPGGIRFAPPQPTVVELLPDHQWFSVRITGMPRVHTMAAATGPVIAMEAPRQGPNHLVGPYDWARVVQHEYTHTVTLARTKNRLPHWFTEAAAVYLEDRPKDSATVLLLTRAFAAAELFSFEDINLAFVRPKRPTDRSLAYAQGAWMYEYIITRFGPEAPLKLMDRYAAGATEAAAFQSELGVTRESFLADFKAWAEGELRGWGVLPPAGAPTIAELLRRDGLEEPTAEVAQRWLEEYPGHGPALELLVDLKLDAAKGKVSAELVPWLEKMAALRPLDEQPHKLLAGWYLNGGASGEGADAARAVEHLEWLDLREQHSAGYAVELTRTYAARGELDKAWEKARRAVGISPYDAGYRELAATVALQRKDFGAARAQLEALVKLEPDRAVHKQRLDALERLAK